MIEEQAEYKATELDSLTAAPHLQMIKAALPYINLPEQRILSLMVKVQELSRTMKLFEESEDGLVGICSLGGKQPGPLDMLNAIKPFGSPYEQEFIDTITNFLQGYHMYQDYQDSVAAAETAPASQNMAGGWPLSGFGSGPAPGFDPPPAPAPSQGPMSQIDQFKAFLPPEQQSKLEMMQMLMSVMQPAK